MGFSVPALSLGGKALGWMAGTLMWMPGVPGSRRTNITSGPPAAGGPRRPPIWDPQWLGAETENASTKAFPAGACLERIGASWASFVTRVEVPHSPAQLRAGGCERGASGPEEWVSVRPMGLHAPPPPPLGASAALQRF